MRYLGGKSRLASILVPEIQAYLHSESIYYEPFVGSASVAANIECKRLYLSDICYPLIVMFKALQQGWQPPNSLLEKEWEVIKEKMNHEDPLTAFAGFGCSFGGSWFGSYVQDYHAPNRQQSFDFDHPRHAASISKAMLLKRMLTLKDAIFEHKSYDQITGVEGAVFYCDPPYQGTAGYKFGPPFNHDQFWRWANQTAETNTVLVSEYYCPDSSWECIWEHTRTTNINRHSPNNRAVEKLFMKGWLEDETIRNREDTRFSKDKNNWDRG